MLWLRACWALRARKQYTSSPSGRFTLRSSVLEGLRSPAIKNLSNSLYESGWAKLCCRKQTTQISLWLRTKKSISCSWDLLMEDQLWLSHRTQAHGTRSIESMAGHHVKGEEMCWTQMGCGSSGLNGWRYVLCGSLGTNRRDIPPGCEEHTWQGWLGMPDIGLSPTGRTWHENRQ